MEQKSEYVQEVFTEIADSYDQMNDKMTWGMLKGWQKIRDPRLGKAMLYH